MNRITKQFGLLAALVAGALVCGGFAATDARAWDVSGADYLTEEEYKDLSGDEATAYCEALGREIDIQNDNAEAANASMPGVGKDVAALKSQLAALTASNEAAESEVAELAAALAERKALPRSYTVVPGDFLIRISGMQRIYGSEDRWKRIYRGNRDGIDDPNRIFPGQVFSIPRGSPDTHVVIEGESLQRIAAYWEVLGSAAAWELLYEANRGQISDPDLIHPGMVLTIP
ncbi:MAG: LysM peptidoglycan-binding domain-containing protein [Gemmatimonadota bacterium]|jgi:nucleoid-associated protein YgaU|nr:LysM peptidoglycan-binding domain-containing protein [Gemmatimonadota bacterium]MDP6529096.1 LysM peptidoglycan-binding domain-containing protein [Gemmatimonadota bacterium]MDP6801659.1 LysM peptidoglycan-binding domain-containing protein [Gemmatimonadota bacterium]MDP7030794.1 LysM peptidoglycan-binding domain-containing protein [Gemmatimonadota bacterium]